MQVIEVKTYKFEELSDKAKEKAREWWTKDGLDEHECECITEDFQYVLEEKGLPSDKVHWRLSCCQGDGVAFYGSVDVEEYLTKNKLKTKFKKLFDKDGDLLISNVTINNCNHHYHHYNTMSISYNEDFYGGYDNPTREQACADFVDYLTDHIKELSKQFEKNGYESIDYYNSSSYIDEILIINEYDFLEDGGTSLTI
jgi:hypothetical protein